MPFHESLFPPEISYGSQGGPKFKTTIFTADSGFEQRNVDWENVRCEYDVSHGIKTEDQMEVIRVFFMARFGRAYAFRFKDWGDYKVKQQVIGEGDGAKKVFQIVKTYVNIQAESGETHVYTRKLYKIAWGSVAGVTVGGVVKTSPTDYSVDYNKGIITFVTAPPGPSGDTHGAEVKIGYAEFHVPVRFDTDHLDPVHDFWKTQSWSNIPLVEDRNWSELVL